MHTRLKLKLNLNGFITSSKNGFDADRKTGLNKYLICFKVRVANPGGGCH